MDNNSFLKVILEYTAWRMEPPRMYGAFHLVISAVIICLATAGALWAKRLRAPGFRRLFSVCGWGLVVMEIYKQLFLYYVVNDGVYDWWYFPFQLCSMPMYLCVLLSMIKAGPEVRQDQPETGDDALKKHAAPVSSLQGMFVASCLTFLASYTLIGAAATFIVPEDILRSYVSLTFHGFIWHGILLFIGLTVAFSGKADLTLRGFTCTTGLFLVMCVIAVIINVSVEPVMQAAHADGLLANSYAAMFYLNPYHISPQPIVGTIQKSAGIPLGLALYVIAIILAAGLVCFVFRKFLRK